MAPMSHVHNGHLWAQAGRSAFEVAMADSASSAAASGFEAWQTRAPVVRVLLRPRAMGEPRRADGDASVASHSLDIATVEAPIALCSATGALQAATSPALALLRRASVVEQLPLSVPPDLWRLLERTAMGEAVEWRPPAAPHEVLGCTRYSAAPGSYVLLMREVSAKRLALSERLNRQRVDANERLVASLARDLRSSIASIVYSADFLNVRGASIEPEVLTETVRDISKASSALQHALEALLDFARLGPTVSVPVPVREVLNRAVGLLRTHYRDGGHRVRMDVAPRAEYVRGNPLVIEQILVNLLLNAVEASAAPRCVIVTAFPALRPLGPSLDRPHYICMRVWDDGPGIPPDHRGLVFDPFFTTKQGSPGLGLAIARQAAESLEGALELTEDETGTCFSLYLPGLEGAP
jgi:signal transduction histidine kinase